MTHTIAVLVPSEIVLTSNKRPVWREKARKIAAIKALFAAKGRAALRVGGPIPTPTHCLAHLGFPDPGRRRDANNWGDTTKPAIDAFVDVGLLPDDDFRHVVGPDHRIDPEPCMHGFVRITLIFEELT